MVFILKFIRYVAFTFIIRRGLRDRVVIRLLTSNHLPWFESHLTSREEAIKLVCDGSLVLPGCTSVSALMCTLWRFTNNRYFQRPCTNRCFRFNNNALMIH